MSTPDGVGYVLLSFIFGCGAGILSYLMSRAWIGYNTPRQFQRWHDELEQAARSAITADLYAVETKARLFQLIGNLPEDFEPTVFLTANIGKGIQLAVIHEAESKGLVPIGTLERVYGSPLPQYIVDSSLHNTELSIAPQNETPRYIGTMKL